MEQKGLAEAVKPAEEKPKQLLFSQDEMAAIFDPTLIKAMFTSKA